MPVMAGFRFHAEPFAGIFFRARSVVLAAGWLGLVRVPGRLSGHELAVKRGPERLSLRQVSGRRRGPEQLERRAV